MLESSAVDREVIAYRMKLVALIDRFMAGERSLIAIEAQAHADALVCLMEEAPLAKRPKIDHLIDRYESLRINCSN
ncbi:MAG: hypothetical protein EOP18_05800 [Rhizobiaceae bacterium]|nr:MAG: hypothetical protein EOP18_05800 [Rhizobiaceae bacterium]